MDRKYDIYSNVLEVVSRSICEELSKQKLLLESNKVICEENIIKFLEEPPRPEFGDIALPLPRLRSLGIEVRDVIRHGNLLISRLKKLSIINECKVVGAYLNIFLNEEEYAKQFITALKVNGEAYGFIKVSNPKRIVVEFISANPIHPLHIGSGRNAALGEFISRVLEAVGHKVERRYYVNDLGLQVAYLAYGYNLLGKPSPPNDMKVDHFLGLIYAATTTLIDLRKLKEEAEKAKELGNLDEYSRIMNEIDKLVVDIKRIRDKIPGYVDELINKINKERDPQSAVSEIMRKYELGDEEVSSLVRDVVNKVLKGIKETLRVMDVKIDVWDWESDLVRSSLVSMILDKARKSPYATFHKGAIALDFNELLSHDEIRELLNIPKAMEVPPLILMRSDGTTLYTTRDIAYTIKKFREFKADKVINVIAIEQTLPQAQLRLALYALGYTREAVNTIHYSYEMVNLPGKSMSGRRGRYVTIDELISNLRESTRRLMLERGVEADEEVLTKIARSAFKYMMLATSPNKVVVFDVSKALDISKNSAPYLQYTYARANGVLSKYGKDIEWHKISYKAFKEGLRRRLLIQLSKFPNIVSYVATYLHPEDLVSYLNKVADIFNSWYDQEPIIKEPVEGIRNAKLALTYGVKVVIGNGLRILGLDILERI